MRKVLCLLLAALLILSGCSEVSQEPEKVKYEATFLDVFDTVTTIVGYSESKEAFSEITRSIHDEMLRYHQLFDIYNDYPGISNLKTVNDSAGGEPVKVDQAIIDLLLDCKSYYDLTGGKVNVAMGSVLQLWHEARNDGLDDPANAALPSVDELREASAHTDLSCVIIDPAASTVCITDPNVRLDVGAVAKGWSVQRVSQNAPEGLLISVGGNIVATGAKDEAGTPWVVGIRKPDDADAYLHTIYVKTGSVVTSGDYQRAYTVDGKAYHHIIDPVTLFPGTYWRSVTIIHGDSGLSDALSTALFLLPLEEGQKLLDTCGALAMWVNGEGEIFYSPGIQDLIRT